MSAATVLLLPHLPAAETSPVEVVSVFKYANSDPYDRANLYGFNHAPNVTTLPDGRLMAAWFSGPYEAAIHQVILGATSSDGGKTWSEAAVLVDTPRKSDFDPAFVTDGKSTWLFFAAGRWNRYPFVGLRDAEKREVGIDSYRISFIRSDDSGKIWTEPKQAVPTRGFTRANGIVLKSGQLLVPVYDDADKGKWVASVLRSDDQGATWKQLAPVGAADGKAGGEPTIAQLDNGDVLIALRSRDGRIWFSQSSDAGETWKEPYAGDFDAAASSHALFRTKAGRVFLAYNASKPPLRSPLVLRELDQKTMKWGEPLSLASVPEPKDPFWSRQVSYPSITELADGTLVVVWTEISMSSDVQSGEIFAARIKL